MTLLVCVLCLLFLASCRRGPATPAANHVVSDLDLPATLSARVGETIELALSSNASTGYSWHCTWAPQTALVSLGEGFAGAGSTKPGSGGTTTFTFKAMQPGQVVITVQYGRWWKGGDRKQPQTVTVNVTP